MWEDALHFVAPGRHDLNYFTVLALVGVVALLVRRAHRTLAFCAITVAAPVLFFSFVPASGDSALFFDRYMIPVTPAFLTVVLAGCLAIARWAGRWRFVALVLLVAGLLAIEIRYDVHHRDAVHRIGVDAVDARRRARAARDRCSSARRERRARCSRRSTTGTRRTSSTTSSRCACPRSDWSTTTRASGRSRSCTAASDKRYGVWVFYAARPERGERRLRARSASTPVAGHYFVVRSAAAGDARAR